MISGCDVSLDMYSERHDNILKEIIKKINKLKLISKDDIVITDLKNNEIPKKIIIFH